MFSTFLYQQELSSRRGVRRIWRLLRKTLTKIGYNPACSMRIHGRTLALPLSHELPRHLKEHPFYDSLPARLSDDIYSRYGFLKCVDVGANIGDSLAAFQRHESDRFLAIEPNPSYLKFLQENFGRSDRVKILPVVCSSSSTDAKYRIMEQLGTAAIVRSQSGTQIQTETLDKLIADNPDFSDLNLLKIDTDGHDLAVIEGAQDTIKRLLPAILFEFHSLGKRDAVNDCLQTLAALGTVGYSSVIVYDNYGYLMGRQPLNDLQGIQDRLLHHLGNKLYYFDFLLMKEDDSERFFETERLHFMNKLL